MPSGPCPVKQSQKWKVWVAKTLLRRGTALLNLSNTNSINSIDNNNNSINNNNTNTTTNNNKHYLEASIVDYERALTLDPQNSKLKKDISTLKNKLELLTVETTID